MATRIIIPVMPRNVFFQNYICRVVIRESPNAEHDAACLLYSKGTLVAHVQHDAHQDPQLSCQAALQLGGPPRCTGAGDCSSLGSGILFTELHEAVLSPFLQLLRVSLDTPDDPLVYQPLLSFLPYW